MEKFDLYTSSDSSTSSDTSSDIDLECESQGSDSQDREIVEHIAELELEDGKDFINDQCEFCNIECGSLWFLGMINGEYPVPDEYIIAAQTCNCDMC